jgi:peptidoglycan/xylan/chitin deacetylase (PgdA/CDA1 family)
MRAILTYHSIDQTRSVISIAPEVFREHVQWIADRGIRVLPLDDLLGADASDGRDAIAITFDDGFANVEGAARLLSQHGFPSTVFVVSAHVGGTNEWGGRPDAGIPTLPLLGWQDLERLATHGVTIGAHTRSHARLTVLDAAAAEDEMDACAAELRTRLGNAVRHYAYPSGDVNGAIAALAAKRFATSVTTRFSVLTGEDQPMWLPRLDMYYFRRPGAIRSWGTWRFGPRVWSVRTRRRVRETFQ